MKHFWNKGELFVKQLLDLYPEPKPHFNTLSTQTRTLEKDGFLTHKAYGNSYCYSPVISEEDYKRGSLAAMIKNYFNNSYRSVVSTLVKEEKLSMEDLREIIRMIENEES